MTVSTQNDEPERRRFTPDEFQTMLDEGILLPQERAQLLDGFVMVPDRSGLPFRPVRADQEPAEGVVPSDQLVLEAPLASLVRHQEAESDMNALTMGTEETLVRRKFNVDEYYRMAEVGILSPDERTELLEGEIIVMAAIGSKHAFCVRGFNKAFAPLMVTNRVEVTIQDPVFLEGHTNLQPDAMLVRLASYSDGHPQAEDILLLVEVADTTIGYDRGTKFVHYACHGIPEAWLADVNNKAVEKHTEPHDGAYTKVETVGMDGFLTPTALPDVRIAVNDVFRW